MNKRQMLCMWAGICALVVQLIFPPMRIIDLSAFTNTGLPEGTSSDGTLIRQNYHALTFQVLDIPFLMLHILIIAILTTGLMITFRKWPLPPEPLF